MANVQDLDSVLREIDENPEQFGKSFVRKKKTKTEKTKTEKSRKANPQWIAEAKRKKGKAGEFDLKTANLSLLANADAKMKRYLKTSPQYKIIEKQLDLLREELLKYHKLGDIEMTEKTKKMILELSVKKSDLTKIFDTKPNKEKTENVKKFIKESPVIKKLKEEQKELDEKYFWSNPNSIMKIFSEYRDVVENDYSLNDEIISIDDIYSEDFDEIITEKQTSLKYSEMLNKISEIIDEPVEEILKMTNSSILTTLKKVLDTETVEKNKLKADAKKMEISSEIKRAQGKMDITDVIFEIFDFEQVEENQPKEMLAASNIKYVNMIAYKRCADINKLELLDDAVSYGLLGLSIAINKWYKMQRLSNSAISFEGMIYQYVSNTISRGLYQLVSSGDWSPSYAATLVHKRKRKMKLWLENNPELKDLPEDMIENLIPDFDEAFSLNVTSMTDYEANVTGGENSADVIANAGSKELTLNLGELKMEYEQTLKGLKSLFGMFETKVNKETGLKEIKNKRIFDIYDYIIFRILIGIDKIPENEKKLKKDGTLSTEINQDFIIKKINEYNSRHGITKTFSQPAISARYKTLLKKIKIIIDDSEVVRNAFEFLLNYHHTEEYGLLSNQREEYELDSIDSDYDEITKYSNNTLSDDMNIKISEKFSISDTNMLDEEIASIFEKFEDL